MGYPDNFTYDAIGLIREYKNFTDFRGISYSGFSPIPSLSNGEIVISGGAGNHNQYITFDELLTNDENTTLELTYKMISAGFGLAIGRKSINDKYQADFEFQCDNTDGSFKFYDTGVGPLTNTNSVTGGVAINAQVKLILAQRSGVLTGTVDNITSGNSATISMQADFAASKNFKVPNTGKICVWNFGGTMNIQSLKVSSRTVKKPRVVFLGDSKTTGFSSGGVGFRFADKLLQYGPIAVYAGDGDRTVEHVRVIDQIAATAPKYAVLCIGRNDLNSGIGADVWQANYARIVQTLQNKGTTVIHMTGIPETTQDQTVLNNYINATYPSAFIIDSSAGWVNGTHLSADNVHPNATGHLLLSTTIAKSGLLRAA